MLAVFECHRSWQRNVHISTHKKAQWAAVRFFKGSTAWQQLQEDSEVTDCGTVQHPLHTGRKGGETGDKGRDSMVWDLSRTAKLLAPDNVVGVGKRAL